MADFADIYNRPVKILWKFPMTPQHASWMDVIPSKSTQELAARLDHFMDVAQIESKITHLTKEQYDLWYQFYVQKMKEQQHDIIATPDWFTEREKMGREMWLIDFSRHNVRIGAMIITYNGTRMSHAFKASERIHIPGPKNLSLGTLLDLHALRFCAQQHPYQIFAGKSRNGFGYYNTIGYLLSKLRMGFIPQYDQDDEIDNNFPSKEDVPTAWFVLPKNQTNVPLTMLLSHPFSAYPIEFSQRLTQLNIPCIEKNTNIS